MEVYTPIPESMLPGTPRAVRGAGRMVLAIVVVVVGAAIVRATFFAPASPLFRNYGVVHTSVGTGAVVCGGDVSEPCGVGTTIQLASCSAAFHDYFDSASDSSSVDRRVRELTGKRPPSGSEWAIGCGGADGLIQGQRVAHLASD